MSTRLPVILRRVIATARLRLRPFASPDSGELLLLFRDADVRRYLLDDVLVSAEWVAKETADSDARFAGCGGGLWSIRLTDAPDIIGFVGFREFFEPPRLQLLYGLLPAYWGRGLATEAASCICNHAFRVLGFDEINAATDSPNQASQAVLRRLGMKAVQPGDDCGQPGTTFFVLKRAEWHPRSAHQ